LIAATISRGSYPESDIPLPKLKSHPVYPSSPLAQEGWAWSLMTLPEKTLENSAVPAKCPVDRVHLTWTEGGDQAFMTATPVNAVYHTHVSVDGKDQIVKKKSTYAAAVIVEFTNGHLIRLNWWAFYPHFRDSDKQKYVPPTPGRLVTKLLRSLASPTTCQQASKMISDLNNGTWGAFGGAPPFLHLFCCSSFRSLFLCVYVCYMPTMYVCCIFTL
jgi:hypothetical protein